MGQKTRRRRCPGTSAVSETRQLAREAASNRTPWLEDWLERGAGLVATNWITHGCFAVLLGFITWVVMAPIINPDFGWHAALGRYMVENRTVATTEPLSHTAYGKPMVAHEWLSQVAYHLVIDASGVLGLRWLHAGLTVGILVALFAVLRRRGVSAPLALLGTFAYFVIAHQRFEVRPHLIDTSFLFGMYTWVFLCRPQLTARQLLTAFGIMVLWVNSHSGAVLFPALVVIYAATEILSRRLDWYRPRTDDLGDGRVGRLLALSAVCSAALVVTPNHFRLFPYVIESQRINAPLSLEWRSILEYWDVFMKPYSVQTFWIVAVATVIAVLARLRRRSSPSSLAVILFLAYMPIVGHRFVSVYFAPVILVFTEIGRWVEADLASRRRWRRVLRHVVALASVATVAVFAYPVLKPAALSFPDRLTPAWNFRVAAFPSGAVEFLADVQLEGNLFASADWGGYVALHTYPYYRIFIDGRWVTLGEQVFEDSREIHFRRPRRWQLLDQYDIDIILEHREWMPKTLLESRRWITLFENYFAGVYLRNTPRNRENLRKVADYYAGLRIPFDEQAGFREKLGFAANLEWAKEHFVARRHMKLGKGILVNGW